MKMRNKFAQVEINLYLCTKILVRYESSSYR